MKLTKKLEAEIRKLYETFWESYINGDLETYASLLDEDFKFIGSTEAEPLLNKKDSIKFLEATAEQLRGNAEFRNRNIKVETIVDLILITELCDGYIRLGSDWNFYSRFRLSSLLKKKKEKWKFIHQHVSMPDSKAQEGESFGLEQIRTENIQLRDAVKRRTIELENKNRELEIESAVERVRARALAMHRSEEILGVVVTMQKELIGLNISGVTAATIYLKEDDGKIRTWDFTTINKSDSDFQLRMDFVFRLEETDPGLWIRRIWSSKEKYLIVEQDAKDHIRLVKFLRKFNEEAAVNVGRLIKEHNIKHSWHPTVQLTHGKLNVDFIEPPPVEMEFILPKMGAAFDLAYKRFLDLKNAEAQTREAKIEAALERVRSRSMGMQKSDELKEVIQVVYEQFVQLNIHVEHTGFIMDYRTRDDMHIWLADKHAVPFQISIPYFDCAHWNSFNEAKERGIDFFANQLSFEEKNKFYQDLFTLIPGVPEETLEYYFSCPGLAISTVLLDNVGLYIENFSGIPYTDEENNTLMRFGKVFQQTYARFLDLQKAESQTREAQIETALEKVRSHTMGMRSSDDLANVATVMFDQMRILGGELFSFGIVLCNKHENMVEQWHSIPHAGMLAPFFVPVDLDYIHRYRYDQWKAGVELFSVVIPEDYISRHFELMLELPSVKAVWEGIAAKGIPLPAIPTWEIDYGASFRYGYLLVSALKPFEEDKIFPRFAKVFEQAYIRFLDLQKAEAQARESQIEAALERVRSRTMGMQQSDELGDVATVLFKELNRLVENLWTCGFVLCERNRGEDEWWLSTGDGFIPAFYLPNTGDQTHANIYDAWKKGETYHTEQLDEEGLQEHYDWLMNIPVSKKIFDDMKAAGNSLPVWQKLHCAYFSYGYLVMITQVPCTEEQIFKRFAQVFDQTYTRFLDLQKAEAQAREAQIELGLERVRARAMAMQKSDELSELVDTVFKELTKLDFALTWCIINIIDESSLSNTVWAANPDINKAPESYHMLFEDYPFHHAMLKGWKERRTRDVYVLEGKEKKIYDEYLFNETEFRRVPAAAQAASRAMEKYVVTFSFSNFGGLQTVGDVPLSDGNLDILSRFGKVFDLTYTRFNDLKQAEAQAREAKIEAALERVRSRAMAMHKTDELLYAAELVGRELSALGITSMNVSYAFVDDDEKNASYYSVNPVDGKILSFPFIFPHTETDVMRSILSSWKKQEPFNLIELDKEATLKHQTWIGEHIQNLIVKNNSGIPFSVEAFLAVSPKKAVIYTFNFAKGYLFNIGGERLTTMQEEMVLRFTKVFDMTYRRFLDLKQAEAQAREAQIQLAMERVRARTMAMQKSEELAEAASLLFTQIADLGTHSWSSGFIIFQPDELSINSWMSKPDGSMGVPFNIPVTEDPFFIKIYEAYKRGEEFFVLESSGKELEQTYKYMFSLPGAAKALGAIEDLGFQMPTFQITHCVFFPTGFLMFITYEPCQEMWEIFKRFGKVFEQTYTRFLDLQKAEAQAREAKIEAALEKIRSRSLGMHHSVEIKDVVSILFEKLKELNLAFDGGAAIHLFTEGSRNAVIWVASPLAEPSCVNLPYDENAFENNPIILDVWHAKETGDHIYNKFYSFEEKNRYFDYVFKHNDFIAVPKSVREFIPQADSYTASFIAEKNSLLGANSWTRQLFSDDDFEVLKRVARVFEQAYIRFLDLQKAEAQTREAKIEAALERIRSRTMAMQKSDELTAVAGLLFEQVSALGIKTWTAGFNVWSEDNNSYVDYITSPQGGFIEPYTVLTETAEALKDISNARKSGVEFDVQYVEGEKIKQLYLALTKLDEKQYEIMLQDGVRFPSHQYEHFVFGSKVSLMFITYEPVPEAHDIFKRLGKVFEQTYTRFLDLQKAEAQARESQIQLALERVRARTMAMQKSEELPETSHILFEQMKELGEPVEQLTIGVVQEENKVIEISATLHGDILKKIYQHSLDEPFMMSKIYHAWKTHQKTLIVELKGDELNAYNKYRNELTKSEMFPTNLGDEHRRIVYAAFFSKGMLALGANEPRPPESLQMLERFAGVFDQAYIRFIDLKNAEAQAREAQIEAALERVRSRTMAMQKSEELPEAANVLFLQVQSLGIPAWSCGYNILAEDKKSSTCIMSSEGEIQVPFELPLTEHSSMLPWYEAIQNNLDFFVYGQGGKDLIEHYKYLATVPGLEEVFRQFDNAGISLPTNQINHLVRFTNGFLLFITYESVPHAHDIFIRFGKVFDQTYTRFLDLQKAEAQAREAIKQASVDRVRAEIASMRTTNDLERIQPIIWNELTTLGVPFVRCGVFIMDEEHERVDTFLSTPEGESIASFTSKYSDLAVINEALPYWRRKEIYKAHWDEATFLAQAKTLLAQGNITSTETYLTEHQPKDLYLHFLPFLQGILYVGNETPLNDEELQSVQNLADAFSIAYARYEDFNKLELAKGQIEKTLVDLKQTQAQLVQSEKMASLGELTAGIAHEIQNPLNFVNNFSDVNKELLVEMKEEIDKGNIEEVKAIANDIIGNEEKINHHGKRADAIVKGMLQHSRSSSGVKEPADINVLADEYLRLAYHGLRAKDKFFNATFKTAYDESIGKINIVPQDIGRSVLNLITNAFYAVAEKKKQNGEGYEPTVTVTTKRINGRIEIRVADNGNGIPQKVLDKIFQPFFTTKPTGQGTGLGLSLCYDIIKAHGGEINVETKEGEGSDFFIFLPANN